MIEVTSGVSRVRDLPTSDEAMYEAVGVQFVAALRDGHGLAWPHGEWGPLYSTWYGLLSVFCPDRVRLYDFAWTLLVSATTFGLYALARSVRMAPWGALIVGAAPLATSFFYFLPYANHLCLLVMLGSCWAAQRTTDGHSRATILVLACGLGAFIRPEVAVVGLVLFGVYVIDTVRRLRRMAGDARGIAARASVAVVVPLALGSIFGSPIGGPRGFTAFAQHYAFTTARRQHLGVDPWVDFEPIVRRDFGDAATIWEALAANPRAFASHVLYNVSELPSNVLDLCALRSSTTKTGSIPLQVVSAIVLVAAVLLLLWGLTRRRTWRAPRRGPVV